MAGRKKASPGHWIDLSDKKQTDWIESYLAKKQEERIHTTSAQDFLAWCKHQTDVTEFEKRMRGAWAAYKSRKNTMQKGMVTIKIHKQTHEIIQRLANVSGSNTQEVIHEVVENSARFIKEAKERLSKQSEVALAKRFRVLELTADKRRRKDELLGQIKNLEIFIANLEQVIRTHSERRALLEHHKVAEDNIPEELFDRINQLTKDEFCSIKKPLARIVTELDKMAASIYRTSSKKTQADSAAIDHGSQSVMPLRRDNTPAATAIDPSCNTLATSPEKNPQSPNGTEQEQTPRIIIRKPLNITKYHEIPD